MKVELKNTRIEVIEGSEMIHATVILDGKEIGEYADYVDDGELVWSDNADNMRVFSESDLSAQKESIFEEKIRVALADFLSAE